MQKFISWLTWFGILLSLLSILNCNASQGYPITSVLPSDSAADTSTDTVDGTTGASQE